MFGSSGPLQIGDANVRRLPQLCKPPAFALRRRMSAELTDAASNFDCASGKMTVESASQPACTF